MVAGVDQWASTLLGSGLVGTPILTLVLTGRLVPVWVVRRQIAALEKSQSDSITALNTSNGDSISALKSSHKEALEALNLSHQRELTSKDQAHADALAVRDREAVRQGEATAYERGAKDIERSRADAATGRLGDLAAEYGASHAKLLGAIREAASSDGA